MSKKEITSSNPSSKKLRTKELIYAGAFGALYIVLMLVIVLGTSMIPVLYLLAPITVGLVCGTVYMLCVLKVKKFGAALILGVLFALCACSNAWFSFVGAVAAALLAEVIIKLGNYKSKKLYLLSFVVFNTNMACPYMMLSFARDSFLKRSVEYSVRSMRTASQSSHPRGYFCRFLALHWSAACSAHCLQTHSSRSTLQKQG